MEGENVESEIEGENVGGLLRVSELECVLCSDLLADPITLPGCGHTLCRLCLHRALEVKPLCPLCRSSASNVDVATHPPTLLLVDLISKFFPRAAARRKAENDILQRSRRARYGLFLSETLFFPGTSMKLHIFQPQYRVLISRALAATRTFIICHKSEPALLHYAADTALAHGTAIVAAAAAAAAPMASASSSASSISSSSFSPGGLSVGCVVKINRCHAYPDGRSLVECSVLKRVLLSAVAEEEGGFGLLSAQVEDMKDTEEEKHSHLTTHSQSHPPPGWHSALSTATATDAASGIRPEIDSLDVGAGMSRALGMELAAVREELSGYLSATGLSMDRLQFVAGGPPPCNIHPSQSRTQIESTQDYSHSDSHPQSQSQSQQPQQSQSSSPGGPVPWSDWLSSVDSESANGLCYWLCRAVETSDDGLKWQVLHSSSLLSRLSLCRRMLVLAKDDTARRSKHQSTLLLLIVIIAVFIHLANKYTVT